MNIAQQDELADFGIAGVGVMGSSLALNMERKGYSVVVWDREPALIEAFVAEKAPGKRVMARAAPEELARALKRPRRILLMVKAGAPVDWTIEQLKPALAAGDILIDGGNSWFEDTRRREAALAQEGLRFIGMGVSGGERGALEGPALMPGGARAAYAETREVWERIAAQTEDGACVTHIGPDGAGHFVKMAHNGIEYGDMQLIAEAYDVLRRVCGMEAAELADTFARWNEGLLESYLIRITAEIFRVRDEEMGAPLVDLVLDRAEQKGTGKWTAQVALDLGVPTPTINAAIEARFLSALKDERVAASRLLGGPREMMSSDERARIVASVGDALYASKICSYAQGFSLMRAGSAEWNWGIDLSEVARIWKGGCIIRARVLDRIKTAYRRAPQLVNLLLDEDFRAWLEEAQASWRECVALAQQRGIPVPAMAASLAYYDSYRTARLPQNLTQAQRDYFGAHTYKRADQPERGAVHTDWEEAAHRS